MLLYYELPYVTGAAKRDQVGTVYTNSHNGTYLEFCVQYLISVSCKMLPMKLLTDGKHFTYKSFSRSLVMMQQMCKM